LNIRKATEEDVTGIAHVHVETWRSTYAGIIPDDYLNSLTIESRTRHWRRNLKTIHSAIFVAENANGEIIGFAAGGTEQTRDPVYQGEIYAIYILKEYQRQGIGKQLIKPILDILITKDYKNVVIWALEENVNRAFYTSMGGKLIASKTISIYGKELIQVAYAWENIHDLMREVTF